MSTSLDGNSYPRLRPGVRLQWDHVRKQWVLLAPERVLTLDEIGVALIKKLDGNRRLSSVALDCSHEYDAPLTEITRDIMDFVQTLVDKQILEL